MKTKEHYWVFKERFRIWKNRKEIENSDILTGLIIFFVAGFIVGRFWI